MAIPRRLFAASVVLIVLGLGCTSPLGAQPSARVSFPFRFERFTTADGFAANAVNGIYQDSQGFMWFATRQGLYKYDGYRFTAYRHDEDDPASLSTDWTHVIAEDHEGGLWIGTGRGLNRLDRRTETFTRYLHDPDDPASLSYEVADRIYIDRQGTLWAGGNNGLNRFDPATETFTRFLHDSDDPASLSDSLIYSIYEDRAGVLWMGTWAGGLNRFDPATETFTSYPFLNTTYPPVVERLLDALETDDRRLASILHVGENQTRAQSLLLIAPTTVLALAVGEGETGGLADGGWIENQAGEVVWQMHLNWARHAGGAIKNRMQVGLLDLPPGRYTLYYKSDVGHSYANWNQPPPDHPERWGLQVFRITDEEARQIRAHVSDEMPPWSVSGPVFTIAEDASGTLWLGTDKGLDRFDPKTETFTYYRHDPDNPNSLSMDRGVSSIQIDRDGMLWIGGPPRWMAGRAGYGSRGLTRFDPVTNTFTRFPYDPTDPDGFLGNQVSDVYLDRAGAVWVATGRHGVSRVDLSQGRFTVYRYTPRAPNSLSHYVASAVHESRDGTLWVGTDAGLDRVNRTTGQVTHFTPDPGNPWSLNNPRVKAIYEDREGVLWVGTTGGGLNRFDRATGRFTAFRHDLTDTTSISSNAIEYILEDRSGTLWISTRNGFNRFDRATETFTRYTTYERKSGTYTAIWFGAIYEDSRGTLWAGTTGGLNRVDPTTGALSLYRIGRTYSITEDREGRLWAGSDQGLFRLDPETEQVEAFADVEGMAQGGVMGVVSDAVGILWFSTEGKGLVRFNPGTGAVRAYDLGDGLPSLNYHRTAAFESPSGEVFFAGPGGVTAFHPERMQDNPYVPPVVLTGFTVRNEPVPVGEDTPLKAHISVAESITLAHDQNDVAFEFAALNYTRSEKNQYAYKLDGYDEAWTEAGTNRQARYTNIPPGDYVFRVRGSNNDGIWNDEGASIRVRVLPPFWQTWWFRIGALAAVLGLAYAGYRWRIRDLEAHSRMLEAQVAERTAEVWAQAEQLQELDRVKSRFFANISHEFRTPLTLMLGPLQDALHADDGGASLRRQVPMMQRHGRRLLRLINQLLDLSRLEAGNLTLRARRADLVSLVKATAQAFASMAQRKHIALQVEAPQQEIMLYFEPDKIEKILYNLLSNAFKFTPEHGTIRVIIEEGTPEGGVAIIVRDTGRGIPAEEVPYVFDRFHQVDASSTREQEGSGIGLALTKELVALHGGTIHVESEEGSGTSFFVRLPTGRAHLSDEDIVDAKVHGDEAPDGIGAEISLQVVDDVLVSQERLHASDGQPAAMPPEDAPTVLIVEDNGDVRRYLKGHLSADYHIVEAVDGVEGLEQARATRPDLILADVMMPRMDGYALCRAVKGDAKLNHVPVVLLTARADEKSKVEGLETGADDYLYKPFNAEELVVRVENLIEIRRQLRARFSETVLVQPSAIEATPEEAVFLEQVRTVIEQQLGNSHFGAEWLADDVGLSRRHLDRRLKALTKLSASGLIRQMRLERAAQLLAQDAGRVSEVAYAVGFHNAEHFSKLFQQVFGVAPSRYPADQT